MTTTLIPLSERPAWKALEAHSQQTQGKQLKQLFAEDTSRGERFTAETGGIFVEETKDRITDEILLLLIPLSREPCLWVRVDAMFGEEEIKIKGNQAVLSGARR